MVVGISFEGLFIIIKFPGIFGGFFDLFRKKDVHEVQGSFLNSARKI
jgi:hypothetical protein